MLNKQYVKNYRDKLESQLTAGQTAFIYRRVVAVVSSSGSYPEGRRFKSCLCNSLSILNVGCITLVALVKGKIYVHEVYTQFTNILGNMGLNVRYSFSDKMKKYVFDVNGVIMNFDGGMFEHIIKSNAISCDLRIVNDNLDVWSFSYNETYKKWEHKPMIMIHEDTYDDLYYKANH